MIIFRAAKFFLYIFVVLCLIALWVTAPMVRR